jgi:hypothetical protein
VEKLSPHFVAGFVAGEGCFCVSVSKHQTLKRRIEVRPEFEIELRADDAAILEKIRNLIGCGTIYRLDYKRYKWAPHAKLKVSNIIDLKNKIIPFFTKYPLQAKKARSFALWAEIVEMVYQKKHLDYSGFQKILKLRGRMRQIGKKRY